MASQASAGQRGEPNKSVRILAVDDEPANLTLLKSMLVSQPYEVAFALNGKEAIKRLESNHFDLVLLDIMMPELDGFKVLSGLINGIVSGELE